MDFKVTGTEKGITALQMDIKISGIDKELLKEALEQAHVGRLHILETMAEVISVPRPELSEHAPKLTLLKINPSRIRDLIGPGGKHIKGIIAETGAKISVEDSGDVSIYSSDKTSLDLAIKRVHELTEEPEMGKIYEGKVQKVMEYGAFVEILPGSDGLLHISQIDFNRINKVTDVLHEGDITPVKVIKIDPSGKVSLSRTEALKELGKEKS
jgi:polyribonucleotide nucleotidyltransferase